jgi:hypothetical protein
MATERQATLTALRLIRKQVAQRHTNIAKIMLDGLITQLELKS